MTAEGKTVLKNSKVDLCDGGDEMDPKIAMLIGTVIDLSYLGDENPAKIERRWCNLVSGLWLSLTSAHKT